MIDDELRRSLQRQAGQAPDSAGVVARVLAAAGQPLPDRNRRAWLPPLLAAAAVLIVAGGIALAGPFGNQADRGSNPGTSPSIAPSSTGSSAPVVPAPAPSSSALPTSAAPTSAPVSSEAAPPPYGLAGFRAKDLSFVGTDDGWAIGANPLCTGVGACASIARTTDGRTWHYLAQAPARAEHIRMATTSIGYAYGPKAFYLTTDGGRRWQKEAGDADALETLDGNVIRIRTDGAGCPGPCNIRAEIAPVGGHTWTPVALDPAGQIGGGAYAFARGGSSAYLLLMRNPAGGGNDESSTLYVSHDDGAHWSRHGEPCGQLGSPEYDSTALAVGPDGTVVVGCSGRGFAKDFVIELRDNAGAFSVPLSGNVGSTIILVAAASLHHLFAMGDVLYAEGPDGQRRVDAGPGGGPTAVSFLGFETSTTGRALSKDGRTVWTTTDAGATWSAGTFPS